MNRLKKMTLFKAVLALVIVLVLYQTLWDHEEVANISMSHARDLTTLKELNDANVKMNDPLLITVIRKLFLIPPVPRSVSYNLKDPYLDRISMEMAENIAYMLYYESNGFFVDARAFDGETRSNTLLLERRFNWTGLLVEHDPINVAQIVEKKRKAWVSPSCLSILPYPHVMADSQRPNTGKTWLRAGLKRIIGFTDVQCLPLYSLLLALNRTEVDYLSLDVKGHELEVLKTIPFKDINIRWLSMDYSHEPEGKGAILRYMQGQDYDLKVSMVHPDARSLVFVFFKHGEKIKS